MKKIFLFAVFVVFAVSIMAQQTNIANYDKHNFSITFGYAFRISKMDYSFLNTNIDEDHKRTMRHALNMDFDYGYRFCKSFAIGVKLSGLGSFDSYKSAYSTDANEIILSDNTYILYAGPTFTYLLPTFAKHFTFFVNATIGYMGYRNTIKYDQMVYNATTQVDEVKVIPATYTGSCFGYGFGAGIDYELVKNISVGLNAGFLAGSLSTLNFEDNSIDISNSKEDLTRFNISLGLKVKM
ncbi:MAG: porin family protein [Bacteroidales bacterium]|jgi:opacity protein-like surface antigen|nr:porin family protein [Bacteroidales bacterium]